MPPVEGSGISSDIRDTLIKLAGTGVNHLDASHRRAGRVGDEPRDARIGHQSDVRQVKDLPNAIDVRIRLGVDEAGIAIAGVATDAFGCERVGLIALEPERHGKGVDAKLAHIVFDRLHAGLVREARDRDTSWNEMARWGRTKSHSRRAPQAPRRDRRERGRVLRRAYKTAPYRRMR